MDSERAAALALDRCGTRHAPDDRVAVFDPVAVPEDGGVTVRGRVSAAYLRRRAVQAVDEAVEGPVSDEVTVLEAAGEPRAVAEPLVPCRSAPDGDAERVTEVLYGARVTAFDGDGDWRRVRVPDGYLAWVPAAALVAPAGDSGDAVLTAPRVEAGELGPLYAGSPCAVTGSAAGGTVETRFATGATTRVPETAVARHPGDPGGEDALAAARSYLGTPYRWGGMTVEGIDCSGLVWAAYRRTGVRLPRDADQQRRMGRSVDRDELAPGDLLFFPGHVAVSAGGPAFVHAYGEADGVVESSLDPADAAYEPSLDESFACARRVL